MRLAGAALAAAIAVVYVNSLNVPFLFDDPLAILENPTIRQLWPLSRVILPPRGEGLTVEGRPVLNLTLALNYAFGGTAVRGYHVVNILIHTFAAWTLFGVVRRALRLPQLRDRFGPQSLSIAATVAALWALHPLQTESVTYVIQRAESLVGLLYLLTLYGFVRGVEAELDRATPVNGNIRDMEPLAATMTRGGRGWFIFAVIACFIGMATKEVMVSAPLLVFLFDRSFAAGTLRAAWRRRWPVHLALFSTWILLGALVLRTGTRGGTAGFGIDVTPFAYALTQFEGITRYVGLAIWPHPLIFDYGVDWVESAAEVLPFAVILLSLIAATVVAWWRWPAAWLGILFFAVLSPTSSIVPGNRQTLAEHRMYLPLAAIIVLGVCVLFLAAKTQRARKGLFAAGVCVAMALGVMTVQRNTDYHSELRLYADTVAKRPHNGFARYNLGQAYAESGRHAEAVQQYEAALPLLGGVPGVHYNLANSLATLGRREEALAHYEAALRREPNYARAHFNLGNVLVALGRKEDAQTHFARAVALEPALTEARANLGGVLLELGRLGEARKQLEAVLRIDPKHVLALFNLGNVCLLEERASEAVPLFENVIALRPDLTLARDRLEWAKRNAR